MNKDFEIKYFAGLLGLALYDGDPKYLIDSFVYYKQGKVCNDCIQWYYNCECEYCDYCKFNQCLCNLNIINGIHKYYFDCNIQDSIRIETLKFIKSLINNLLTSYIIDFVNYRFDRYNGSFNHSHSNVFNMKTLIQELEKLNDK